MRNTHNILGRLAVQLETTTQQVRTLYGVLINKDVVDEFVFLIAAGGRKMLCHDASFFTFNISNSLVFFMYE